MADTTWRCVNCALWRADPERFDSVARQIEQMGLRYTRRSLDGTAAPDSQVLLGDTMGELLLLLGAADIAFIGGSLIPRGGHNSLEAAAWGLPVLTGPSDFNFAEISQLLQSAAAQQVVDSREALHAALDSLFSDATLRQQRGQNALAVVDANRGALQILIEEVEGALQGGA